MHAVYMVKVKEMQEYELEAWLGDTAVTPAQFTALWQAADAVERAYPGVDQDDARQAALTRAAQVILGDAN